MTRAWIERYTQDAATALPTDPAIDTSNLVHAADIWFSVRKYWCIEAQRYIRAAQRTKDAH